MVLIEDLSEHKVDVRPGLNIYLQACLGLAFFSVWPS